MLGSNAEISLNSEYSFIPIFILQGQAEKGCFSNHQIDSGHGVNT